MFRAISFTITATFFGQAFSFFADIFIAGNFGTSWKADAYFLALTVSMILTDFFMAAINAVFIPSYMAYQKNGNAEWFFSIITNVAMIITSGIAAITFFLSPIIIDIIARGFTAEAKTLTVTLTRILLLLIIMMPLSTILSCRLNAHRRFVLPALGKSFNFGFLIVSLFTLKNSFDIFCLPAGLIVGNLFFILSLLFLFYKASLGYLPSFDIRHPVLKETGILLLPLVAATMVNYVNIFIERSIATTFSEGSISALNYAFKIVNIPLSLFILGGITVVMPIFSKYAAEQDLKNMGELTFKALSFISFFIMPIITGIVIFRDPIVRLLFERGQFSTQSSGITSIAVFFYVFGLFGLAYVTVMSRVFYAMKDITTLSIIGISIIVVNIILILSLSNALGFIGIPLTFSITSTVHMIAMLVLLGRRLKIALTAPLLKRSLLHCLASLVMGMVVILFIAVASGYTDLSSKVDLFIYLFMATTLGIVSYMVISHILRVKETGLILEKVGSLKQRFLFRDS